MTSILEEAGRIVHGDRNDAYGHPADNLGRTATIWSVILNHPVTPEQVALCMVAMKISRHVNQPHRDNLVDAAGYLATIEMLDQPPHPHRYKDTTNARVL